MKSFFTFLCGILLSVCASAQNGKEIDPALVTAANNSLRNLQLYNCQTVLIQMNLDAHTLKNWDAVIAKANECISIEPSALSMEIRGEAHLAKGDITTALADLTKAIPMARADMDTVKQVMESTGDAFKENYENAKQYLVSLYTRRSDIYVLKADRAKAQADLKAALAITPNDYSAKDKLSNLDKNIAEKQKEARIANPRNAADHVLAGSEYLRDGKYKEALASFNKALAIDSKNAEAYLGRGEATTQLSTDRDKAIADYNMAISLSPKLAKAYVSRAYAYINKKDWDAAIADLNMAIKQSSATASLLNSRASAYLGKGKYNEALTDYTAAIPLAAGDQFDLLNAMGGVGDAYKSLGRKEEALEAYNKAIAAGKGEYMANIFLLETYVNRAGLYEAKGMRSEADADLKVALKIAPDHPVAKALMAKLSGGTAAPATGEPKNANDWALLGRKQFQSRQYDDAVISFSNSIKLEPTAYYYSLRGFAQASKGDMTAFNADFDKAIKIAPSDKATYYLRGMAYGGKGMKAEAAADFRKVLQLDPGNENAKSKLKELGFE